MYVQLNERDEREISGTEIDGGRGGDFEERDERERTRSVLCGQG